MDEVRIFCDVKGCDKSTISSYPFGVFAGWKWLNGLNSYICPECRRKLQDKFGNNWEHYLELKIIKK
jgi:hypothetical protein